MTVMRDRYVMLSRMLMRVASIANNIAINNGSGVAGG